MKDTIKFPKPLGPFVVGITQIDFDYTEEDQNKRELPLTIYYPADSKEGKKSCPYAFPEVFGNRAQREKFYKVKTQCYPDVQVSTRQTNFPVLMYNAGYGSYVMQNTVLCSDFASYGYVVVAIGHPGEASALKYKDGRIIKISQNHLESMTNPKLFEDLEPLFDEIKATAEEENELLVKLTRKFHSIQPFNVRVKPWVIDTTKTVDFLKKLNQGEVPSLFRGKLNLEIGLGITGHSFGGSTAIQTLHDDPRFVCGVNVDGGHFGDYYGEDIQKPLLMIGNPHIWKLIKAVFLSNSKDVYHLTVKNADHLGFTDFIYILKNPDENSRIGSRNPDDFRLLLSTYQLNFFNQYLLQKGSALEDLHFEETRFYKKLAGKH